MSLLSVEFVALSTLAIVVVRAAPEPLRTAGFTGLSLWFVTSYLDLTGLLAALAMCVAGYGFARAAQRRPRAGQAGVALLTIAFVWMQRYSFLELVLPETLLVDRLVTVGLSFLFFKVIHVIVDAQADTIGELRPTIYLAYCLNFTAFLLGPIQRYQSFESQWNGREEPLAPTFEAHLDALNRVLRGFVKKYVVAEFLAAYALLPGQEAESLGLSQILLGVYVFYFFLYFDFSGYCDIVIGVGSLMGVRPPENFWLPFFAPNIWQYWLRVHKSLTLWLTDYIFNPTYARLLRSRRFARRPLAAASLAMMITMLVAGPWHGTTMNFLLFGLVHGIYLVLFRLFEGLLRRRIGRGGLRRLRERRDWRVASTLLTFNVTACAYAFFVLDTAMLGSLWVRVLTKLGA